jgi:hypothetical protein
MERRLAAILAADVIGYWRLMEADEVGVLGTLQALQTLPLRYQTLVSSAILSMDSGVIAASALALVATSSASGRSIVRGPPPCLRTFRSAAADPQCRFPSIAKIATSSPVEWQIVLYLSAQPGLPAVAIERSFFPNCFGVLQLFAMGVVARHVGYPVDESPRSRVQEHGTRA